MVCEKDRDGAVAKAIGHDVDSDGDHDGGDDGDDRVVAMILICDDERKCVLCTRCLFGLMSQGVFFTTVLTGAVCRSINTTRHNLSLIHI